MLRNTISRASSITARSFSTSARVLNASKIDSKHSTTIQSPEFQYQPQVLTKEEVLSTTGTPFPVNVELNYYAPLRHEKRHGDLVAEIQLRAYDHENLDFLGDFALRAAYYLDIPVSGVFPLPTRRERWTVIRAPFVHAKSKENFLRLTHKRCIKAYDATPEVIDLWISYLAKHSNAGVGIKVTTYQNEGLDFHERLDKTDLKSLAKEVENSPKTAISKRVQELLNDPVFKKHLGTAQEPITEAKTQEEEDKKQIEN
ncbi:hypothetical protein WICPIJ_001016 [Wickerhamomyces pijperi]|uniref:Small ribosomal subunit protein uS10m n=1 Tax=Wickerhamomyces pijperi TaxID=599730 RepID=A0A9P8QBK0_WICPI|nr:hypothetical protein WICPIJ_001016 [Wickerhamomyces pijperi]